MVNITKEQIANLTRYSNFRMNESMIPIIFEYLLENSLDYAKEGSYEPIHLLYKNNDLESFKSALDEEIIFLKKIKKDMIVSGDNFSKEFKVYDLLESIFEKIKKFVM
ncbi:MAG: hypothetical protein PF569_05575 [Candidatus Woesearchaeota archaeon]|jgi:hypothetical protein|nr:hypothetical protein [Candidatus Woesearchaeota archaeon]